MIGVVTTSYPRFDGDPAGGFVEGLSRWVGRNHDVEVVCADGDRRLFYRGGAPELLGRRRGWLGAAAFSSRLMVEVAWRARRWDAVMSHWMLPCGLVAAVAAPHLPHLCVAHGSDARMLAANAGGRRLARWLAARSELVYVAEALRIDGAPGRVAPMGVSGGALAGSLDRATARRLIGVSDDDFVVAWLGRLTQQKGPDVLCDAMIPAMPGVVTLIAGVGPLLPAIQRRDNRSLRLMGEVIGDEKHALLRSADILVVSSRSDGAPVVIAEAQSCGLPVVASAVGGIPELVVDEVDGLLVPPGDAAALRSAICRLRESPSLLRALGRGARARGEQRDWQHAGPRIVGSWASRHEKPSAGTHVFDVRRL